MKNKFIILLCAAALVIFSFRGLFATSDEKAIENHLDEIQALLEFDSPVAPLGLAQRLSSLKGYLTSDIKTTLLEPSGERSYNSFDPIKTGALAGSRMVKSNSLNRLGTTIRIQQNMATADFRIVAIGTNSQDEGFREIVSVSCQFQKIDDTWLLSIISVELDK